MSFKCEMGVEIPSDGRCPDCGADDNQNCGKWVTWAEEEVEKVPALTEENERLKAQLSESRRECAETTRKMDILAEAMAEVKATNDGGSDQTITEIVAGCIAEINNSGKGENDEA